MRNSERHDAEIGKLVHDKIEVLRPKLLDLTARNPLIRTRITGSSSSFIRVVDELPDVLFARLNDNRTMKFAALPLLEDEPGDEKTKEFSEACAAARATDETFREALQKLDANAPDYLDKSRKLERALKDRVREELGLPPRASGKDLASLTAHARAHGITPSYDLPKADEESDDGRHTDDLIQTLQLPRDMERRLNNIVAKARTWQQETGVNVLQAAFGFLEWSDPNGRDTNFSPLVILPVGISSRKSVRGMEFVVSGSGEGPEVNGVLDERLKRDLGLSLPAYEGGSVEEYFAEIADIDVKLEVWRVRRQVVFGIFPSSRIAMYHDLDTGTADFAGNDIVRSLMAGVNPLSLSPFAEDYDVDEADRDGRTPLTVMDADSSQVSTLLDITDGKNLAVEGPPGTGKSQTIVNAIAAALAEGKKVLFVAEKLAALDVVKSRLEAVGLGEFILPLQAGRSSREDVVKSLRDRLDLRNVKPPRNFEYLEDQLRTTRDRLSEYISILKSPHQQTGRTVHEVLGSAIATGLVLDGLPADVRDASLVPDRTYDQADLQDILEKAQELDAARAAVASVSDNWDGTRCLSLAPFEVDEILDIADTSAKGVEELQRLFGEAAANGIDIGNTLGIAGELLAAIETFSNEVAEDEQVELAHLLEPALSASTKRIVVASHEVAEHAEQVGYVLKYPLDTGRAAELEALIDLCNSEDLDHPDAALARERIEKTEKSVDAAKVIKARIDAFIRHFPNASNWSLHTFHSARELVQSTGRVVLELRNTSMSDPAAAGALVGLIEKGRRLAAEKAALGARFVFDSQLTARALREDLAILKNAGALSIFSAELKHAKRRYLAISRNSDFAKQTAINELSELAAYLEEQAAFLQDPKCVALFGLSFAGTETNFGHFEQLAHFLKEIDARFPGPEFREVRAFLKNGDLDLLESLPDVGKLANEMTVDDLGLYASEQAARVSRANDTIKKIAKLSGLLNAPETVTINELQDALNKVRLIKSAWTEVAEDLQTCGFNECLPADLVGLAPKLSPWMALATAMGDDFAPKIVAPIKAGKLEALAEHLEGIQVQAEAVREMLQRLAEMARLELDTTLSDPEISRKWLAAAAADRTGLLAHVRLTAAKAEMEEIGFLWIVDRLTEHDPNISNMASIIEALVARHLARQAYADYGDELKRFSGMTLNGLRTKLKGLDVEIIQLSRKKLRAQLIAHASPPAGNGVGRKTDYTDMALVWNEVEKKKRFIPVRDLLRRASDAILELKPCWMMSPQAVAQYVPKGSVEFDLCIIDEASQMPPEDAIGALYRSRQGVIVGDTNQLPPTSFFQKMLDDDDYDDDDAETVLQESVLEMAKQTFRPARRLRWHYRSKHAGLISFSNKLIYNDDLVVFPSPDETRSDMGVSMVHVPGRYKKGLNTDEARLVLDAATKFMRDHPNRSLGIVTLNKSQADHLQELFDNEALPSSRSALDYVEKWREANDGLETFFIKNLENVQGDERDVIFISTVYGPEAPGGPVAQRFGPINGVAGQRRLNVLFSRAKQQIVTFSSMTAGDIVATESANKGAWMLKRWLQYSATGVLEGGETTEREPDSDFERFVIDQVKAIGCTPVAQVGVSGYFIDIGVQHPEWPHGFLLGIECDGAAYHSGRSARDRDRLRQAVLEDLGWRLHRIWSTDWFANPRREVEILREVISERLIELKKSGPAISSKGNKPSTESVPEAVEETAKQVEMRGLEPAQPAAEPGDEGNREQIRLQEPAEEIQNVRQVEQSGSTRVEIGDTVRLRYLTHGEATIQVTISRKGNDQEHGMIGYAMPLAEALLDAEEGEEVEVLKGSYLRKAVIEKVMKGGMVH